MSTLPLWLRETPEGTVLLVHAMPRASRTMVSGEYNGRLKIKVQAPPVDGAANKNLKKFLAKNLNLPKKSVELVSGEKSRQKTFLLRGMPPLEVHHLLK